MTHLEGVKLGDRLFVKSRYDKGRIEIVDRITPTGRVVTKSGEFNPDGARRGGGRWNGALARKATDVDIASIHRERLIRKLAEFKLWERLSADDLKTATDIIAKYGVNDFREMMRDE